MSEIKKALGSEYREAMSYAANISRYGCSKMPPLIITCAMTGSAQGAEVNPALPETVEDQAQSAYEAYNAGASMVHIHARDPQNLGYLAKDAKDFRDVNQAVREKCPEIIINNTMGGFRAIDLKNNNVLPQSLTSLEAEPEVASIDLTSGEVKGFLKARKPPLKGRDEDMWIKIPAVLTSDDCEHAVDLLNERNIKPEWEVFDIGELKILGEMLRTGKVDDPVWIQCLFGGSGGLPTIDYMLYVTRMLPPNAMMSIIGIGPCQTAMLTLGILLGHHVRVGLEDNYYYAPHELAKSNAQMVERVVRIAEELGRPVATPAQAREMLGLGAPKQYT